MLDLIEKLISSYNYSVETYRPRGIFGFEKAKKIKIEDGTSAENCLEKYSDVLNILMREFGEPVFVHSYYGFIFERDKKFIAYNVIEESYGYDAIDIFLFNKIPSGKKMTYNDYIQVENTVKSFAREEGFFCNDYNHYNWEDEFLYIIGDGKSEILITIKRAELRYCISKLIPEEEGMYRVTPTCKGTEIINRKDVKSLQQGINIIKNRLRLKEME